MLLEAIENDDVLMLRRVLRSGHTLEDVMTTLDSGRDPVTDGNVFHGVVVSGAADCLRESASCVGSHLWLTVWC